MCWIIFYQFPFGFIPDYLKLLNKIESGTYNSIVGNFASILALIIPILVLLIGLLRDRLKRYAIDEFLQNQFIKSLITLTLCVFVFNIVSILLIQKENPSSHDLNLAYFVIFSTVLFLIALFPLILKTIESVNPKGIVIRKVNALRYSDFPELQVIHFEHEDDNPVLILGNILHNSYRDNDNSLVNQILYSTTFKTCEILIENKENVEALKKITNGVLVIWKSYSEESIKNKDYSNLGRIFECLEFIHSEFSKNKIYLIYLRDIDDYIKNLLTKIINERTNEPLQSILNRIEKIVTNQLIKSSPNENKIRELEFFFGERFTRIYPTLKVDSDVVRLIYDEKFFDSSQWEIISQEIPNYFYLILDESIKVKRIDTFRGVLHSIKSLQDFVQYSSLGKLQKEFLTSEFQMWYFYYQTKAIKNGLVLRTNEISYPNIRLTQLAIEHNNPYVINIMRRDFEFIKELHNNNLLDLSSIFPSHFGAIGRYCMMNLTKQIKCKGYMLNILRQIKELKILLEKDKGMNKASYQQLYEDVDSFLRFYKGLPEDDNDEDKVSNDEDYYFLQLIKSVKESFQAGLLEKQ